MSDILVDEIGYKQFQEELERLKMQSLLNSSIGSNEYKDAIGDGWHDNFAFEDSMRESRKLANKIEDMMNMKNNLKIIKQKKTSPNIINIGDILKIKIIYSDDDIEEITIKLTGNFIPNTDSNIQEITLNSPLGQALYLKNIKDNDISYTVNNNRIRIEIIEKIENN